MTLWRAISDSISITPPARGPRGPLTEISGARDGAQSSSDASCILKCLAGAISLTAGASYAFGFAGSAIALGVILMVGAVIDRMEARL